MEKEILQIKNYIDGVNDELFFDADNPVTITAYEYTANRMGSVTLSASFMYPKMLDDYWDGTQYVEFQGEKYYVNQVPTSSKDNTDERYKYEVDFVSERKVLESVYFFDVVTDDTEHDKYQSNSSKVIFYGDINEFAKRLNYSLKYSNLDYTVVVDEGVTSAERQVSFEDKFMYDALQEIYNTYNVPFYFDGKTIHIGYTNNAIAIPFAYGFDRELLSITKTNANYKIVNRCTGTGSSDNIPYYYPNPSDDREAVGDAWITPSTTLMPPIYRQSGGAERFYNAVNDTYPRPDGGYYTFENEYKGNNPKEQIVKFEDIKPTIVEVTNANGDRIDMIAEFAYDSDDNDDVDAETGDYLHPYFYARLRKMDGEWGFNLFEHAITANTPMTISMTSGNCASCNFEIGVVEKVVDGKEVFQNPVQVDGSGNIVAGSYADKVKPDNIQPQQQDTSTNSVWIALKKDINTFGTIMPSVNNNYKPSSGDTFVILYIELPQAYIDAAEKKLEENIIAYMLDNNSTKFNFSINFSQVYFAEHPDTLALMNENARLIIEYNNRQYTLYISSYSYKVTDDSPLPTITVDLADTLSINKGVVQTIIDSVKGEISSGGIGGGLGGDWLAQLSTHFLRKDQADATNFLITFFGGLESNNIESRNFTAGPFGTGYVLKQNAKTGRSYMEIDEIYVRLKAYFETLEIKHLSHVGGRIVLSPASMECIRVEEVSAEYDELYDSTGDPLVDYLNDPLMAGKEDGERAYRCYFKQEEDGKEIVNEFAVDDLAQCREFNVKENVSEHVSNQYYWRRVLYVGKNYIDLSIDDCDPISMTPKAGDTIVTIGNKTDINRQHVVFLSSYDEDAPCFKLYSGINDYSMLNKEVTVISPNADKNIFTGQVVIKPGSTGFDNLTDAPDMDLIEQEIQDAKQAANEAKEEAKDVEQSVGNLKEYVNGAFSDGIISEAEAQSIEKYINIVNSEKSQALATYNELYNNPYLEGSAKTALNNAKVSLFSSIDALINSINTAIADSSTTASEKADVDSKYATFTENYNKFYTAVEAANKSIQDKLKGYSDNAQKAADEANNNASQAMEDANEAKEAVTNLNDYVDGAFADGIISEAEAKAIEKYINIVNQTKKDVDSTYSVLYNNPFLTGTAKQNLYSAKSLFNTATSNLISAINSAIADGKTTTTEKNNVDSKYSSFNSAYASLATAIENANKAIQEKIKEEAITEAKKDLDAQIGEVSKADKDEIAKNMGYSDYEELQYYAQRAQTIIKGGHINTELIEASLIVTSQLIANAIKTNSLNVNNNFIVNTNGSVDMSGILHSLGRKTELIVSDGYVRIMYNGKDVARLSVNETTGVPELNLSYSGKSVLVTPERLSWGFNNDSSFLTIEPQTIGYGIIKKKSDGILYVENNEYNSVSCWIYVSPSGGGTTSPQAGMQFRYEGQSEYVEAFPATGYEFDRWSDGGAKRHLVTWTQDNNSLTAYFTKIQEVKYTLSLNESPSNGGTTTGEGSYTSGTKVTVNATPNSGWRFVRWSDGLAQQHTVTMNANKSLTAYFEKYSVTGDEIFSGTALTSSTYWEANGSSSIVSVTGGIATIKFSSSSLDATSSISFNKGYLGSKIEQGHKYRLSFQIKSSVSGTLLISWIGDPTDAGDSVSSDGIVYGDYNGGNLTTSYKTISFEFTANNRDSNVSDALNFLTTSACTLYIKDISLKEV